ncbi:hypothetical protein LshimejAT787_1702280 [Lyophyllum shimeji]|uniref:Uncharacterized protein n=1 Tax=Lyophyllum shimeji TaxID=47721 RepID=A0A9P3PZQ7_LYOSH|nr:hypothetical protein LshimejAT787_1702280 [Lyophyllum shimeji]
MILFVESGVLYFLFFLVERFAFVVYSFSTSVVVGIYSTALVILAHSENAVLDSVITSTLTPSTGPYKFSTTITTTTEGGINTNRTNDIELFSLTAESHPQKEEKRAIEL